MGSFSYFSREVGAYFFNLFFCWQKVQDKFLIELTKLMSEQQQKHHATVQELEEKMKQSLEERGYDTAAFKNSAGWFWSLRRSTHWRCEDATLQQVSLMSF